MSHQATNNNGSPFWTKQSKIAGTPIDQVESMN
jgi:hypothetical protein